MTKNPLGASGSIPQHNKELDEWMNESHDHASSRKIEEPVLALLVHGILTAMGRLDIILS